MQCHTLKHVSWEVLSYTLVLYTFQMSRNLATKEKDMSKVHSIWAVIHNHNVQGIICPGRDC